MRRLTTFQHALGRVALIVLTAMLAPIVRAQDAPILPVQDDGVVAPEDDGVAEPAPPAVDEPTPSRSDEARDPAEPADNAPVDPVPVVTSRPAPRDTVFASSLAATGLGAGIGATAGCLIGGGIAAINAASIPTSSPNLVDAGCLAGLAVTAWLMVPCAAAATCIGGGCVGGGIGLFVGWMAGTHESLPVPESLPPSQPDEPKRRKGVPPDDAQSMSFQMAW